MAVLFKILSSRWTHLALVLVISLILGYNKGYTDKTKKVEVEHLKEFKLIVEKLDRVYANSTEEANKAKTNSASLEQVLNKILVNTRGKPLSTTPCTPTGDFTQAWRQMDETIDNSK